jgi:hypothetical protein
MPHFSPTLDIMMEDSLNEATTNESWAISDFAIFFISCEEDSSCENVADTLNEDSFGADAVVGWTDKDGNVFDKTTACDRISLVGGYGELAGNKLSKTFTDLPPHSHLIFAVEVWFIDSWDNEDFTITVDQVPGVTTTKGKGEWPINLGNVCGNAGGG